MVDGALAKVREQAKQNPATERLMQELEEYLQTRLEVTIGNMGERLGEGARRLAETRVDPGMLTGLVLKGGKKLLGGGLLGGGGADGDGGGMLSHAKDVLLDKAKEAVGGGGRKNKPDGRGRSLNIIEDVNVGVPVREAYNQWTQFTDFNRFAKGVEEVRQDDEISSHWKAKIAKSRRHWRGTVTEEVPDERIAWTTEGPKGTHKGVVTFHPLGDMLVIQYYPQGLFEKTGGLWRAQGRRVRLDLKLYRAFVMSRGEATGAWRGEIRDGEVVRTHEEAEEAEEREEEEGYPEDEEEEEEEGEEPEEGYADEEEEEADEEEEGEEGEEGDDDYASDESDEGEREEDEDEDRYDETEEEGTQGRRRRG